MVPMIIDGVCRTQMRPSINCRHAAWEAKMFEPPYARTILFAATLLGSMASQPARRRTPWDCLVIS